MGRRIEIYLWTGIAASFVVGALGRRSWIGTAGFVSAGVLVAVWVAFLVFSSAGYRKR